MKRKPTEENGMAEYLKVGIVTEESREPAHAALAEALRELFKERGADTEVLDVSDERPDYEYYQELQAWNAELIITMDLAGFRFRTELYSASYNTLSCRMAHLVLHRPLGRERELMGAMNFSMFFYCFDSESREYLVKNCPNLVNLEQLGTGDWRDRQRLACVLDRILADTELAV